LKRCREDDGATEPPSSKQRVAVVSA
jgi:hypothetical protein